VTHLCAHAPLRLTGVNDITLWCLTIARRTEWWTVTES